MNYSNEFNESISKKITRKKFLQIAFLSFLGLLVWSPFKLMSGQQTNQTNAPLKAKNTVTLSQREYDTLRPDENTLYIIV